MHRNTVGQMFRELERRGFIRLAVAPLGRKHGKLCRGQAMWFDARAKLAEIEARPAATLATTATQAPAVPPVSQMSRVSQRPARPEQNPVAEP